MNDFTGHLPGSREYRRVIIGLFFAGIASFAQLYAPQAVLPAIAADLGVDAPTASLAISAATVGLAITVLPWSFVADRIGRVRAMSIGIVTSVVVSLLAPLSGDIVLFLVGRAVQGAALAVVPAVALAYLAEEVDARYAAAAGGSYVAGTTLGGLGGRLVTGIVGDIAPWQVGLLACGVLCAASAVLYVILIPKSRGFVPLDQRGTTGPTILARLRSNLTSRVQWSLYAQPLLLMGGFVAIYNYIGFRLAAPPFDIPAWIISLLFLAYLAGTVASPRAGRLASRHGRLPVMLVAAALMALGVALTMFDSIVVIVIGLLIMTGSFFGGHAVAAGWAPASADPTARAQASALYYLGFYIGSSLFGWALGFVFDAVGWSGVAGTVLVMIAVAATIAWSGLRRAGTVAASVRP